MASSSDNPSVHISDITIRTNSSKGSLDSVDLLIGEDRSEVHWDRDEDHAFQGTFTPSLDLSRSRLLTLRLHYRRRWLPNESQGIVIKAEELLHAGSVGEGDRREWRGAYGKAEVTIGFVSYAMPREAASGEVQNVVNDHLGQQRTRRTTDSDTPLPPVTDEILRICPRFRILVNGNRALVNRH